MPAERPPRDPQGFREDYPDDYDDTDRGHVSPRSRQRGRFQCPYCGSTEIPDVQSQISTVGWVVLVVLLITCFPLFWIGLLIKEDQRFCYSCRMRLG